MEVTSLTLSSRFLTKVCPGIDHPIETWEAQGIRFAFLHALHFITPKVTISLRDYVVVVLSPLPASTKVSLAGKIIILCHKAPDDVTSIQLRATSHLAWLYSEMEEPSADYLISHPAGCLHSLADPLSKMEEVVSGVLNGLERRSNIDILEGLMHLYKMIRPGVDLIADPTPGLRFYGLKAITRISS